MHAACFTLDFYFIIGIVSSESGFDLVDFEIG
jgi:hypothetical protein